MFEFDKPIVNEEQDRFGFAQFAKALADAIMNEKGSESYVIGIYGQWGSGKTSTMNLLANYLGQDDKYKKSPLVISFSCWGAKSVENLFCMFSEQLMISLKKFGEKKAALRKIGKDLSRYLGAISGISSETKVLAVFEKMLEDETTPMEAKHRIGSLLSRQKRRLVVVIDDLDRLPSDQIKLVFQFVNSVADFDNVTYILPFDYDVVAESLRGVQGDNGVAYMDKVIQIPLAMPKASQSILLHALDDKLEGLIDVCRDDYSQTRLYEVSNNLIKPYLHTMRDVKRLQNVTYYLMRLLASELNSIDVLGLAALLAFQPSVYRWAKDNKDLLLHLSYWQKEKEDRSQLVQSLKKLLDVDEQSAISILKSIEVLFPASRFSGQATAGMVRRERRVCHKDFFDSYFSFSIEGSGIPARSIVDAIKQGDVALLRNAIDDAVSTHSFTELLEEIRSQIDLLESDVAESLVRLLLGYSGKTHENPRGFFMMPSDTVLRFLNEQLLRKLGKERAAVIIADLLEQMDLDNLISFAALLGSQEAAHGRFGADSSSDEDQLVTLDELLKIEKAFLRRVRYFSSSDKLISYDGNGGLMWLWLCFDEAGYRSYWLEEIQNNPLAICYLISASAGEWRSSSGGYGWKFSESIYKKVYSKEEIIDKIETLKRQHKFADMDQMLLWKVIAFHESYNDPDMGDAFSAAMAKKLELDWR